MILDVHESNSGAHPGNQYIRFTSDKEKESEPILRPICFAASFTQIPRYKTPSLHIQPSKLEDVYLGCFANSCTLGPYNDCKCGLAVGMMLSKKYIRKFRIIRTIIAIDHMPRNAKHYDGALVFFIVKYLKCNTFQLFVKGKVSLLFDFKTKMQFMTNDDAVFNMNILTRGLKRKIRNLSIQWISSGELHNYESLVLIVILPQKYPHLFNYNELYPANIKILHCKIGIIFILVVII